MQLVPETKMADARKYSVSGNHWPGEPRGQCLKLHPHLGSTNAGRNSIKDVVYFEYLRMSAIFVSGTIGITPI